MRGEYVKPNDETTQASNNKSMLLTLHPQHQQAAFRYPHFQGTHQECKTPEDDNDSPSSGGATPTKKKQRAGNPSDVGGGGGDGATIEVVRRPRGRPPGSKNKPKPPVIITRDTEPGMGPYILEIPAGKDIIEAISRFCHCKNTGLCVLSGSGTVANVTLKQPPTTPGATVTFHGRFDILSISATFLVPKTSCPMPNGFFAISLAGPQGQIVGGLVAGSLLAAGTVHLVAASFSNPSFHRLNAGAVDDHQDSASCGGGDQQAAESFGVSMYADQQGCDVIWAPAARQPQPTTPPY